MQNIFEENKSNILQGDLVWTTMPSTDVREAAEKRERICLDHRVQHYWDPDRMTRRLLSQTLQLKTAIAWDVYMLYPPDHLWDTALPPAPEAWMPPLDEEPSLLLDPLVLNTNVLAMIERFSTR